MGNKMTENGLFSCRFEAERWTRTDSQELSSAGEHMLLKIIVNHYIKEAYTFIVYCDRVRRKVGGKAAAVQKLSV